MLNSVRMVTTSTMTGRYAVSGDAFLDTVPKSLDCGTAVIIDNDFYQARQAWSAIRPLQQPHSDLLRQLVRGRHCGINGKHADVFARNGRID